MPTTDTRPARVVAPLGFALLLLLVAALGSGLPAFPAGGPQPVSPGATDHSAVVEARCPTFQWAGVAGARGYALTVFRVSAGGGEPELVTRVRVAGDARGWTPSGDDCLERGQRYAWSVAAELGQAERAPERLEWSSALLFEVDSGPSLEEVEQAIAVLERHRAQSLGEAPAQGSAGTAVDAVVAASGDAPGRPVSARPPRAVPAQEPPQPAAPAAPPRSGVTRIASAATPTLGNPSLRVSANVALGADSNLFKGADVFLWDDTTGNTALGRDALGSASGTAKFNTAVGWEALSSTQGGAGLQGAGNTALGYRALRTNTTGYLNTASGFAALFLNTTGALNTASGRGALYSNITGSNNVASGNQALFSNTTGYRNTASGAGALYSNTTGLRNTASGFQALFSNTTGSNNIALGYRAGLNATTGSNNIFLGHPGVAGDANRIRIGTSGVHGLTYIHGVGSQVYGGHLVVNVATGQVGQDAASSARFKESIEDVAEVTDRLLAMRPVTFRYKKEIVRGADRRQLGLIAEEVAELFPELVRWDTEGRPFTVRYDRLSVLLLRELQAHVRRIEALEEQLGRTERKRNPRRSGRRTEPDADPIGAQRGAAFTVTLPKVPRSAISPAISAGASRP